ncbi:LruC domain-containing protein [uncultured Cyclobacterium sp.]|uniref:LruC domain-containing protein n=1 Tax=uncultured Cyclobacterium sp. TaxID=453820 RepID=UPI0030EC9C8E|tara:strand:- start:104812 stop:106308 length:1497 start_codon:yes stop_codon:yes gene_type:complete
MRKILFCYLLVLLSFQSFGKSEYLVNDGEIGNINDYYSACWDFYNFSLTDKSDYVTEGKYSFLTKGSKEGYRSDIKSPWIKFEHGKVDMDVTPYSGVDEAKIYAFFIPFDAENKKNGESSDYEYLGYHNVNHGSKNKDKTKKADFNISKDMEGELGKIHLVFVVYGDDVLLGVDNIEIPGAYYSDPSSNCFPKGEKKDSDGDGVVDDEDDYPDDKYKAYNNYLTQGPATLMFEDLWPAKGDYDFNDLVLDYEINRVTDAGGDVVEVLIDILPRAAGAGYSNGFGIEFTGISPSRIDKVEGLKISSNSIHEFMSNGLEEGNEHATIIAFDKVNNVLTHPGGGAVGINTDPKFPLQSGEKLRITMYIRPAIVTTRTSEEGIKLSDLTMENFNPFLIVNQKRGIEVHLPGKMPTAHVDKSLFGTKEDNSTGDEDAFYRGKESGLPWALNVTESIPYLINKESITKGYNMFYKWAATGGKDYPDWYKDNNGYRSGKALLNAK